MRICPNCKKELNDKIKFCGNCGTCVSDETVLYQPPKKKISEELTQPLTNKKVTEPESAVENTKTSNTKNATKGINPFIKKCIMFGGLGVACITVVIVFIVVIFTGKNIKKQNNYVMYMKEEEIFFNNLKKNSKSWQVTTRLIDFENLDDNIMLSITKYNMSNCTYVSKDSKYIFFADKLDNVSNYYFNLYYREINKEDSEAFKIDSDVRVYCVNDNSTLVTYTKGEENNLYQYNIKDDSKEKVASNITNWKVSDDGKTIIYTDEEYNFYRKESGEDKEKIASNISRITFVSDDFKTIYYEKDSSLYIKEDGEDKVKIDSDVYDVVIVYETGEIYYVTKDDGKTTLMDYVIDDKLADDNKITGYPSAEYPIYPDKPSRWDYDSNEEYTEAYYEWQDKVEKYNIEYERVDKKFREEVAAYEAKIKRDELRESLKKRKLSYTECTLYYYDGNEAKFITDTYYHRADDGPMGVEEDILISEKSPVISYMAYDLSTIKSYKLSEISSVYELEEEIENSITADRYITVKEVATVIEPEKEVENLIINKNGTLVYYLDDVSEEKSYGDLYQITISKGVVGEPQMYDSDVMIGGCEFVDNTRIKYFKDYSKFGTADLYIDKEKIDYDVYYSNILVQSGKVVYMTDYNDEKCYGTLKVYEDKKSVTIGEEVYNYCITPDGRVVYLYDYSMKYYKGELYVWDNGEKTKIDDDVMEFINIDDNKYRYYSSYSWIY